MNSRHEQPSLDFTGLEDGYVSHASGHPKLVGPDEGGFEFRLALLEKHRNDLLEVRAEFLDGGSLRVGASPARDIPNEQASLPVALDDEGVGLRGKESTAGGSVRQPNERCSMAVDRICAAQICRSIAKPSEGTLS